MRPWSGQGERGLSKGGSGSNINGRVAHRPVLFAPSALCLASGLVIDMGLEDACAVGRELPIIVQSKALKS